MILLCCVVGAVVIRERKETMERTTELVDSAADAKFAADGADPPIRFDCTCDEPGEQVLDVCMVSLKDNKQCRPHMKDPISKKKLSNPICVHKVCYEYDNLIMNILPTGDESGGTGKTPGSSPGKIPHDDAPLQWQAVTRIADMIPQCTCGGNGKVGSRCYEPTCREHQYGPLKGKPIEDNMVEVTRGNRQGAHVDNSGLQNMRGVIKEPICIDGMCYDKYGLVKELRSKRGAIPHNGEKWTEAELNTMYDEQKPGGKPASAPTDKSVPWVCASEDDTCMCTGTVVYGRKFVSGEPGSGPTTSLEQMCTKGVLGGKEFLCLGPVGSKERSDRDLGASIECSNRDLGDDPVPNVYKHCYCIPSTSGSSSGDACPKGSPRKKIFGIF